MAEITACKLFSEVLEVTRPGMKSRLREIELTPEAKRMLSTTEEKMRRAFGEPGQRRPVEAAKAA